MIHNCGSRIVTIDGTGPKRLFVALMNALTPIVMDFRPAYDQLRPDERRFVDGYVSDLETLAGKTGERLTVVLQKPFPYPLDQRAMVLLASVTVRTAIVERVKTLSELIDANPYRSIKELAALAYSNISNYLTFDELLNGPVLDWQKATNEQLAAVKSIEIEERPKGGRRYKFQLHDKLGALTTLMKHQGLLAEDNVFKIQQDRQEKETKQPALPAGTSDDQAAKLFADFLARSSK